MNPRKPIQYLALISLIWFFFAPAIADQTIVIKSGNFQTAVVELYTSEGCSSCPPADRWLSQLIEVPSQELDALALAFHVDYWDYIGWTDEFASTSHTDRQRRLARINRQSSIYTPEFFVDGLEARGTLNILEKIRKANKTSPPVELTLTINQTENQYQLGLASEMSSDQKYQVQFVVFENNLSNQVDSGENAGKQLKHQGVVRHLSPSFELLSDMHYEISVDTAWQPNNQGIAALIKSASEEYIQSVYSLLPGQQP